MAKTPEPGDMIYMRHPDAHGKAAEVAEGTYPAGPTTYEAFTVVWEPKGWELCDDRGAKITPAKAADIVPTPGG